MQVAEMADAEASTSKIKIEFVLDHLAVGCPRHIAADIGGDVAD